MTVFEDRLWSELLETSCDVAPVGAKSVAPRRNSLKFAAAGTAIAAVLGTSAALALDSVSSPPAFAVTQNTDGTITVDINELTGVSGANAQLASLGVRAEAIVIDPSCTSDARSIPYPDLHGAILGPSDLTVGVTIHPAAIPAGDTLLLGAKQGASGQVAVRVMLVKDPAPSCVGGFRSSPPS